MRIQWPYWLQSHKRVSKDKNDRIFAFFLLETHWISPSLLILFPHQTNLTLLIKWLFPLSFSWWIFIFNRKWLMTSVSNRQVLVYVVCTCKSIQTMCAYTVDCGRCWKPNSFNWNSVSDCKGLCTIPQGLKGEHWKRQSQLLSQCFQVCQELSFRLPPGS